MKNWLIFASDYCIRPGIIKGMKISKYRSLYNFYKHAGDSDSGYVTIRPGEDTTVTLVMVNRGEGAEFALSVNTAVMGSNSTLSTDFLEHVLTPTTVFLGQNSSAKIEVTIILSNDVTDELAVAVTVIAESVLRNNNNFITLYVVTTARPSPEFTENVSTMHHSVNQLCLFCVEGPMITPCDVSCL